MANVEYVWLDGPSLSDFDWETQTAAISRVIDARGWMRLNRRTSRILIAEDADQKLLGFMVLQLVPHTEPLWVLPSMRGSDIAETLVERMIDFMFSQQSRGWMVVADNPSAAKLCEDHGMTKLDCPVYAAK